MKKNPREFKKNGVQYAYILDCVHSDEINVWALNDDEKIKYVLDTFEFEYNNAYNKRTYPNLIERFSQWLRGLPTALSVAYANYEIIEIGKSWGYCETEKKAAKFCDDWWFQIASKFFQLARILGVSVSEYY